MGEQWEYRRRKMEIAWEIAQRRLEGVSKAETDEVYKEKVRKALSIAWEVVSATFPCYEDC